MSPLEISPRALEVWPLGADSLWRFESVRKYSRVFERRIVTVSKCSRALESFRKEAEH